MKVWSSGRHRWRLLKTVTQIALRARLDYLSTYICNLPFCSIDAKLRRAYKRVVACPFRFIWPMSRQKNDGCPLGHLGKSSCG